MSPPPRLASIPPHLPFLDTLARRWLDTYAADPSGGLILLPTRRAARALAEAFLHVGGGQPMLLPRITALGALDETPLALAGALDLPPAVEPMQRLAALSRLVLALPPERGGVRAADQAFALARELAALMDEAEQAEIPLFEALRRAGADEYAQHWEITLRFLAIVTEAWPAWLADHGLANPAARQVALLDAQAKKWAEAAPGMPVWAAGLTGATPAVARLLRVVSRLTDGLVVLPWIDRTLPPETRLDETHPQAGIAALLAGMGATPEEVVDWHAEGAVPPSRPHFLAEALLPAAALHRWAECLPPDPGQLMRLNPADEQEEAVAIALILRDALEVPGQRAALVTPDRALASRVSAELLRWGVVADDSAGENLGDTPPAVFLRLLARAVAEDLAPVALLALLKHPLSAAGLTPAACRQTARDLERRALRGPRPPPGFAGMRRALERHPDPVAADLVERARETLEPLLRLDAAVTCRPADLLAALLEAAENLARTDSEPGAQRLWGGEEGEALADVLAAALAALDHLPDQAPRVLPGLLDALLEDSVVRTRRALRGRDGMEHPRIFIWGLLEARLQSADLVALGGLTEGVWPPATDPGPWMSRPMRARAGLPGADARVGQAAHDFVMAACCAPLAILSAPLRRDRAPAVPARWLARLDARAGQHFLARHDAVGWARQLDLPVDGKARPVSPPAPRPPVALRPRRLSVTDIETLIADPYAIYAKHILRLRPLDPLEQDTDALDYGKLVHKGIEIFLREYAQPWPTDPARALRIAMIRALQDQAVRPAVAAWWAPRLERIADWIAAEDSRRRAASQPERIAVEHPGRWHLAGGFLVTAKADRIEQHPDGTLAILDYKTGKPPGRKQLHDGTAPQLPLEAAMAQAGAFPGISGTVRELAFWHLTGGREPGCAHSPLKTEQELAEIVADTPGHVTDLLTGFDNPARPYPHRPHPGRTPRNTDYVQLARGGELAAAQDED
jgi:ATP-dependent helicase/nuclease subunit B